MFSIKLITISANVAADLPQCYGWLTGGSSVVIKLTINKCLKNNCKYSRRGTSCSSGISLPVSTDIGEDWPYLVLTCNT